MKKIDINFQKRLIKMRKTIFLKLTFVLALSITLFSCSEDFLEESNPNNLSTDSFWKNTTDLNIGLIGAYKAFSNANNYKLIDELARTDLAWSSGYQRPNNTNDRYLQTFNEANSAAAQKWTQLYTTIFRANQVIDAVENLLPNMSTSEKEEAIVIDAQAKFIRGWAYFILHSSFNQGSVPIWDVVPGGDYGFYREAMPAETVREFYLNDLEYASENLPNSWPDVEKGRVTAGAAVAVIGQSNLHAGNYPEAALYFKRVIDNFGYSLTENIGSNFTTMDELNEESILELVYSTDYKNELNQWDARDVASTSGYQKQLTGSGGNWFGAVAANWLILEYRNEPLDYADNRNKITEEDGTERFRKFSLRTSYSIAIADDIDMPYYEGKTTGEGGIFNVKMTAFWRKHTNWDLGAADEDAISPGKVRTGINERMIRLAEIYLQYAECMAQMGNTDEALLYINKVRRRSAVQLLGPHGSGEFPLNDHDGLTYNADQIMEHLMWKEYPLELSCEGHGNRNIDLRRWGVKKERFEELAAKRYTAETFTFQDEDGNTVNRWGSIVKELPLGDPLIDENWNEFQAASVNYVESEHAYWKLPVSEEITNPFINGGDN